MFLLLLSTLASRERREMGKKKEESSIDSGPFDTAREMNIL